MRMLAALLVAPILLGLAPPPTAASTDLRFVDAVSSEFTATRRMPFTSGGDHAYMVFSGGSETPFVGVYERSPVDGALRPIGGAVEGQDVDELGRPVSSALSPDDAHLYVIGQTGDLVTVFARDPVTGLVSFVETQADGKKGVRGLDFPQAVVTSPDGAHVYVGGQSLAGFSRDAATGRLTFVDEIVVTGIVEDLVVSADAAHVYSATAFAVTAYARDGATGVLSVVDTEADGVAGVDGIAGAQSLALSPDGLHLYVAGEADDAIAVFARDPGTGTLTFVEAQLNGSGGVTGLTSPQAVRVSPDGGDLYASSAFDRAIVVFSRDALTGGLTYTETVADDDVRRLEISTDGAHVYTSSGSRFDRDAGTGILTLARDLLPDIRHAIVSPDGLHAYAASFGRGIVAYARDAGTGILTGVQTVRDDEGAVDGLAQVNRLAISPDGAHVYAASGRQGLPSSPDEEALVVFSRAPGTGHLTFVEAEFDGVAGVDGLDGASELLVSPDGAHVYVSSRFDEVIAIFSRDAGTGAVTFDSVETTGFGALAVSSDGAFLYAHALGTQVRVFSRDPGTGHLTFVQDMSDGEGGERFALSTDGAHLYAARKFFLDAYARDPVTGFLTFLETEEAGLNGTEVPGAGLALQPDGSAVHVVDAVFSRDPSTGLLTFVEKDDRGPFGQDTQGLHEDAVAVSPDGKHAYVSTRGELAVFDATFTGCSATPLAGCRQAGASSFSLRDSTLPLARRLGWTWKKGDATTSDDFSSGDDNPFAVCAYAPALVLDLLAPTLGECRRDGAAKSAPCWKETSSVKYNDRFKTPDGLHKMTLKPGDASRAKVKVTGSGEHLTIPALPLSLPVTVQLQSADGLCWESVYASAKKNDDAKFIAKTP